MVDKLARRRARQALTVARENRETIQRQAQQIRSLAAQYVAALDRIAVLERL